MTGVRISPSEWGFTAYHPSGLMLAHSSNKKLLEDYVADCVPQPEPPPNVQKDLEELL